MESNFFNGKQFLNPHVFLRITVMTLISKGYNNIIIGKHSFRNELKMSH